mgnify:CR=1 FL=1
MSESGPGLIRFWNDFGGPEIPVANAVAYGTTAGGCNYYLGDYKVTGDLGETDTGVIGVAGVNGAARFGGSNINGKGVAIGTEVIFSPALMGTLVCEARIQRAAVTNGAVFVGFCDVNADDVAEPVTATVTTLTLAASDLAGFVLDSQLAATATWHMAFNGGSVTGQTDSTAVVSSVVAVAGEYDVLRVEITVDGTVRYIINGTVVQTTVNGVSPTVLLAAYAGVWGTTTTAASADLDYLEVTASRDWTR